MSTILASENILFSHLDIATMAVPNGLPQLRAVVQIMDIMDAFDEEENDYRARRRRSVWMKQWLTLRDNPRYKLIKLW